MPTRTVTKVLAGEEDLLFGRGTASQARASGNYVISKLSLVKVVASQEDFDAVDESKFPFVAFIDGTDLTFYEYVNGVGWSSIRLSNRSVKSRASFSLTTSANTSIITEDVATKLLGTTTPSPDAVNFTHTSGRLVYAGDQPDLFTVTASVQVALGNQAALKFFFAVNGNPIAHTQHIVPAVAYAIPRAAAWSAVLELQPNDYVEVYVSNTTTLTDVEALGYNLAISG